MRPLLSSMTLSPYQALTPIMPLAKADSSLLVNPALGARSQSITLTDPVLFAFSAHAA